MLLGLFLYALLHPSPLILASNKQQATSLSILPISPSHRFDFCPFCIDSPSQIQSWSLVAASGAAPSQEVPNEICATWGNKMAIFAHNSPQTCPKQPNERKQMIYTTGD